MFPKCWNTPSISAKENTSLVLHHKQKCYLLYLLKILRFHEFSIKEFFSRTTTPLLPLDLSSPRTTPLRPVFSHPPKSISILPLKRHLLHLIRECGGGEHLPSLRYSIEESIPHVPDPTENKKYITYYNLFHLVHLNSPVCHHKLFCSKCTSGHRTKTRLSGRSAASLK